jgi:hypothetical protein
MFLFLGLLAQQQTVYFTFKKHQQTRDADFFVMLTNKKTINRTGAHIISRYYLKRRKKKSNLEP